ncbi:hypothetical protein SALBM311S_03135 [Streptomyces alboniger]
MGCLGRPALDPCAEASSGPASARSCRPASVTHAVAIPGEQRGAEILLQRAALPAEHILRDVQLIGGAAEVQPVGYGDEVAQFAQVQIHGACRFGDASIEGFIGYPGDGANLWNAVHVRDVASLFRLALEKGPAGKYWHAVGDGGIPFRDIAEAIGSRLGLPVLSIPADVLMVPGYFGFLANIVTQNYPASNLITRRTLGWEPAQPSLLADLDNGHYFSAS